MQGSSDRKHLHLPLQPFLQEHFVSSRELAAIEGSVCVGEGGGGVCVGVWVWMRVWVRGCGCACRSGVCMFACVARVCASVGACMGACVWERVYLCWRVRLGVCVWVRV